MERLGVTNFIGPFCIKILLFIFTACLSFLVYSQPSAIEFWPSDCARTGTLPCFWKTGEFSHREQLFESESFTQVTLARRSVLLQLSLTKIRLVNGSVFLHLPSFISYQEFGFRHQIMGKVVLTKDHDRFKVFQIEGISKLRFGEEEISLPEGFWVDWSLGQALPAPKLIEASRVASTWARDGLFSIREIGQLLKTAERSWESKHHAWGHSVSRFLASHDEKQVYLLREKERKKQAEQGIQKKFRDLFKRRFFFPELAPEISPEPD